MAQFFASEIILGLTVQEFLLHLLNFIILVVCLRLLLYKPVKKFMQKRAEQYRAAEEQYQNSLLEAAAANEKRDEVLEKAREESVHIAEDAHALALIQTQEMVGAAKEEADEIVRHARETSRDSLKKERENLYYSVSDLAVTIAQKLVDRTFGTQSNDGYIDKALAQIAFDDNGASANDEDTVIVSTVATEIAKGLLGRELSGDNKEQIIDEVIAEIKIEDKSQHA